MTDTDWPRGSIIGGPTVWRGHVIHFPDVDHDGSLTGLRLLHFERGTSIAESVLA